MFKTEINTIHVSDGVKVKLFNVTQVMSIVTNHRTTDSDFKLLFEHNDEVSAKDKESQVLITGILKPSDHRSKNSLSAAAVMK